MKKVGEMSYNELLQDVQQQFLKHRENTSIKLQKLEEVLELIVHRFHLVNKLKSQSKEEEFENPFGGKSSKTVKRTVSDKTDGTETLYYLKLNFPKLKEGIGVTEWLQEC